MSARVVIRADASQAQGTGHVMRCLTLAQELVAQDVQPILLGNIFGTDWLMNLINRSGIGFLGISEQGLSIKDIELAKPDFIVIDSYEFSVEDINSASKISQTLTISDSWNSKIATQFILDQNLGAEFRYPANLNQDSRYLLGSKYALIRRDISKLRLISLETKSDLMECNLLCFFGGSDPSSAAVQFAKIMRNFDGPHLTIISPRESHSNIASLLDGKHFSIHEFTPDLPQYILNADAVVAAAGTSTQELGTIGIPTAYVSIAKNQDANINAIREYQTGLVFDFKDDDDEIFEKIKKLCLDVYLRNQLLANSQANFDGLGTARVAGLIVNSLQTS